MSALRLLALSYLASASVFIVAATMATRPELAREFAAGAGALAGAITERLSFAPSHEEGPVARLDLAPPPQVRPSAPPPPLREQQKVAANEDRFTDPDYAASTIIPILPDLSPESAPVPAEPKLVQPKPIQPDVKVASAAPPAIPNLVKPKLVQPKAILPDAKVASMAPPAIPKPETPPHNRVSAANQRLKGALLTPEMAQNFALIVYVSKAPTGPLAQRMLVFENKDGVLKPVHDWAASTGREQDEISPRGRKSFTATPKGFYAFDSDRMYRRYHSWSWDQDMPHAMFFNWERRGMKTGLAIHAATGADIAKLGSRASAGCVHLAPEHAQQLYRLVRDKYRGKVPRFSYNRGTQTMTNSGTFMHDRKGALRMVDGYQVLVVIDDFGGDGRVADLD